MCSVSGLKATKETSLKTSILKGSAVLGNNKLYENKNKDLSASCIYSWRSISLFINMVMLGGLADRAPGNDPNSGTVGTKHILFYLFWC